MENKQQNIEQLENEKLVNLFATFQSDPFFWIEQATGLIPQPPKQEKLFVVEELLTCSLSRFEEIAGKLTLDDFEPFERGKHLTWQQTIILIAYARALNNTLPRKIAVMTGRGLGKTKIVALIVCHFLYSFPRSLIMATAPTSDQLFAALWKEANLTIADMKEPFKGAFEWQTHFIRHKEDPYGWFARAKTAETVEALRGLHCFEEGTVDVLTKTGFKDFKEIGKDDEVMTYAGWQKPTEVIRKHYTGEMVFQDTKLFSFSVTPNHKFPSITRNQNYLRDGTSEWRDERLLKVSDWKRGTVKIPRLIEKDWGVENDRYYIPVYKNHYKSQPPRGVINLPIDSWVAFLGWYLSEGSTNKSSIGIAQSLKNQKKRDEISEIITKLGFTPSVKNKHSIFLCNVQMVKHVKEICPGLASSKRVPEFIFTLSRRQIRIFLDAYRKGDGYKETGTNRVGYVTSSKGMAEDLQRLILLSGNCSTIHILSRKGSTMNIGNRFGVRNSDCYQVREWSDRRNRYAISKGISRKRKQYSGVVECLTVPSHVFYVRDKKTSQTFWTGNSDSMLAVCDEASGIADEIIHNGWATMTNDNKVMILISNTSGNESLIERVFEEGDDTYVKLSFSAVESPIVDQVEIAERKRQLEEKGIKPEDDRNYRIDILGLPPKDASEFTGWYRFFPDSLIDKVLREVSELDSPDYRQRPALGVDPAGEGSDTAPGVLRSFKWAKTIFEQSSSSSDSIAGAIATVLDNVPQLSATRVFVDSFGVGHDVAQKVLANSSEEKRRVVRAVLVGESAPESYRGRYINTRAMLYDAVRVWFENGGRIETDVADVWKKELRSIYAKKTASGKLQIMSKGEMRAKKLRSPNNCFVAGTMIRTPLGEVPIENISVGDKVLTPTGTRIVLDTQQKIVDKTYTILTNKNTLTGTGNHRIFTSTRGLIPIDALSFIVERDSVDTWQNRQKTIYRNLLFLMVGSFGYRQVVDIIWQTYTMERGNLEERKNYFIMQYGNFITTLKSLKDIVSTTKITTTTTMTYQTSNLSHIRSIGRYTRKKREGVGKKIQNFVRNSWRTLRTFENLQKSGMHQKREMIGIKNKLSILKKQDIKEISLVSSVKKNSKQRLVLQNSVQENVDLNSPTIVEDTTSKNNVFIVLKSFLAINFKILKLVLILVLSGLDMLKIKGKLFVIFVIKNLLQPNSKNIKHVVTTVDINSKEEVVYNISVDVDKCYYANDILVSNCDALSLSFFMDAPMVLDGIYRPLQTPRNDGYGYTPPQTNDSFNKHDLIPGGF